MEKGFVYVAIGDDYFQEAILSAESVKKTMSEIPITLVTDKDRNHEYFDNVILIDDPVFGYIDTILGMKKSPYDKTIYLDTDVYVCKRLDDVFESLDRFDIAASPAPNNELNTENPGVPDCFPEFNTGVIAYANIPEFFEIWYETYEPEHAHCQPSFRKSVYNSSLNFHSLPREYNCMFNLPGHLVRDPKILHGRLYEFNSLGAANWNDVHEMAEKLTEHDGHRHYGYDGNVINCEKSLKRRFFEYLSRARHHIKKRGVSWSIKRFVHNLQK